MTISYTDPAVMTPAEREAEIATLRVEQERLRVSTPWRSEDRVEVSLRLYRLQDPSL